MFRILKANVLCATATVSGKHRPHVNTAYFCYSNAVELFFLSHPKSRHCRNLSTNRHVGVTVFSSSQPWGSPGRGVQLFGKCHQATGLAAERAERLYAKRFPAYPRWRASQAGGGAGSSYRFYRVVVSALKLLDEKALGDAVFAYAAVNRRRSASFDPRRATTRALGTE